MRLVELDKSDKSLVEKIRLHLKRHASKISGVAAGLRTSKGKEFFGLCIDLETATTSACAEYSAIGTMVSTGERKIRTIVAITSKGKSGYAILPPCGKCRDFAGAFGDPYVILQVGKSIGESKKVRLSELVPFPWNEAPRV
ncbi:MAG: cytidine deaminase family protein [Nitrososphaerales archaeon]